MLLLALRQARRVKREAHARWEALPPAIRDEVPVELLAAERRRQKAEGVRQLREQMDRAADSDMHHHATVAQAEADATLIESGAACAVPARRGSLGGAQEILGTVVTAASNAANSAAASTPARRGSAMLSAAAASAARRGSRLSNLGVKAMPGDERPRGSASRMFTPSSSAEAVRRAELEA